MHDAPQPHADSVTEPLGDTVLQSETLESIQSAVNYHRWLTSLAAPDLGGSIRSNWGVASEITRRRGSTAGSHS